MSDLTPEERARLSYYAGYEPPEPVRHEPRFRFLRKLFAPIAVAIGLLVKFGVAVFKVFGIFISVAGYALIWGWTFAVGLVALLLVHELGHYVEAKRQGLDVSLPRFVPFIGAYVLIRNSPRDPWRNALVALAGPAVGGLGAAACFGLGEAQGSDFLVALGYTGFLLNLINLIPVGILDGGAILRAYRLARTEAAAPALAGPDIAIEPRSRGSVANTIMFLYVAVAALLALGLYAAHVPQSRV